MPHHNSPLREVALVFLKLGTIGFGGPAAHLAMMENEVVVKRTWLPREEFLRLVGLTNLIPGPNSTEMAMHVGYVQAGWAGLVVAGLAFILPAVGITGAFAWLYVRYGSLPEVNPLLDGMKPVVLAIIIAAAVRFGKSAFRKWQLALVGVLVLAASLLGANEIAALLGGGAFGAALLLSMPSEGQAASSAFFPPVWQSAPLVTVTSAAAAGATVSLSGLGLVFLKVGAVLYGSGYVLIAFLQGELVDARGWLTQSQLLDAIAVGQFTPGPILSTATFVGYQLFGWPGALVATAAVFLPSFVFVGILQVVLSRITQRRFTRAFLDAVTACSVGLIFAVAFKLSLATLADWRSAVLFGTALMLTMRWKVGPAWLLGGGAFVWWVLQSLLGG